MPAFLYYSMIIVKTAKNMLKHRQILLFSEPLLHRTLMWYRGAVNETSRDHIYHAGLKAPFLTHFLWLTTAIGVICKQCLERPSHCAHYSLVVRPAIWYLFVAAHIRLTGADTVPADRQSAKCQVWSNVYFLPLLFLSAMIHEKFSRDNRYIDVRALKPQLGLFTRDAPSDVGMSRRAS
jgi:hypothetical protein